MYDSAIFVIGALAGVGLGFFASNFTQWGRGY